MILQIGQYVRIKDGFQNEPLWNLYEMNYCVGLVGKIVYQRKYNPEHDNYRKYFVEMFVPNGDIGAYHDKRIKSFGPGWWFYDYMLEPASNQLMMFEI